VRIRRRHAGQMGGVDDQHRVELEAHAGTRLDVSHAGQQQRGHHLPV